MALFGDRVLAGKHLSFPLFRWKVTCDSGKRRWRRTTQLHIAMLVSWRDCTVI